jgi:hypothetical protein
VRQRVGSSGKNKLLATVLPANYLRSKMRTSDLLRLENVHGLRLPINPGEWTADIVERLQRLPASDRVFRTPATEPIHRVCLWYTREEELRSVLDTSADQSNRARDVLGLVHYRDATPVAAIYFSSELLRSGPRARPTFVEAGDHRRFKAHGESSESKRQPSWGRTADLKKFAVGETNIDGCPERIARPAPDIHQLRFEILGVTRGIRGIHAKDADATFANVLVSRRTRTGRRTRGQIESRLRSVLA